MAYRQRSRGNQRSQRNRWSPRSRGSSCSQGSPRNPNHLAFYKVFHRGYGNGYSLEAGSPANDKYGDPQFQFTIELPSLDSLDDEVKDQSVSCKVHELMVDNVAFPWETQIHLNIEYCLEVSKRTGRLEYNWMKTTLYVRQQILKKILAKS